MKEQLQAWRQQRSKFGARLIGIRQVLDEGDIDQVAYRFAAPLVALLQFLEESLHEWTSFRYELLRPTLNLCHEDVREHLSLIIREVLPELRHEFREPPHKGSGEGNRLRLDQGTYPNASTSSS